MGTNYYLEPKPPCAACGRPHERRHIGKSSAGWVFSLHTYPSGPRNLEEWIALLYEPGARITDEYGREHKPSAMIDNIAGRTHPHGLVRSPDLPHGPGTWDYCDYDFS